ncbi:MAG: hypothetical protein AABY22_17580 [Nanoarchaeota archaeon]
MFGREEIEMFLNLDKTPSEIDVEKMIAEKFSSNPENVKVRLIKGNFGVKEFLIKADIYKNIEDKARFGMIKKRNRKKKKTAGGKK